MKIDLYIHSAGDEGISRALAHLLTLGDSIMSAISDFAVKQQAHNDKMAADLVSLASKADAQNALIQTLQNSPGPISPADQATLDQLDAGGNALVAQADAMVGVVPPVVPAA